MEGIGPVRVEIPEEWTLMRNKGKREFHMVDGDSLEITAEKVPWDLEGGNFLAHIRSMKLYCYTVRPFFVIPPPTFLGWLRYRFGGSKELRYADHR